MISTFNLTKLKEACWKRPIISEDYILSASHILQAVASYLCMERMACFRHKEQPVLHIDEVARSCGFRDYNYFITMFKREAGMSPGSFRAAGRKEFQ